MPSALFQTYLVRKQHAFARGQIPPRHQSASTMISLSEIAPIPVFGYCIFMSLFLKWGSSQDKTSLQRSVHISVSMASLTTWDWKVRASASGSPRRRMPCSKHFGNHPWVRSDGPIFIRATSAARAGTAFGTLLRTSSTRAAHAPSSVEPGSMCLPWASREYIAVSAWAVVFFSLQANIACVRSLWCCCLAATTVGAVQKCM